VRQRGARAELHPSRDAKASSEMQNLPTRMATGRNPEDDVACGLLRQDGSPELARRRPEVVVAWHCRSLHSLVQDGKSHGTN